MNRRAPFLTLLVLSVVAAVLLLYLVFAGLSALRSHRAFASELSRIDRALRTERWERAEAYIRELSGMVPNARGWYALSGRALIADDALEAAPVREPLLAEILDRAAHQFPDSETIAAIYALALLRADRFDEAYAISDRLESNRFRPIVAESLVRTDESIEQSTISAFSETDDLYGALVRATRAPDPEALLAAGEVSGRGEYAHNAVLQFAAAGNDERAATILRDRAGDPLFSDIGFLFFAGRLEPQQAYRFLSVDETVGFSTSPSADVLLAGADLYRATGNVEEARGIYDSVIEAGRSETAEVSYAARSFAFLARASVEHSIDIRIEILESAISELGHEPAVILDLAAALTEVGRYSEALPLLEQTIDAAGADPDAGGYIQRAQLARYAFDTTMTRTQRESSYWRLFSSDPSRESVARFLASRVVRAVDREGMGILLRQVDVFDRQKSSDGWTLGLRASYGAAGGIVGDLEQRFETHVRGNENALWHEQFNYALYLLSKGSYGDAALYAQRASVKAEQSGVVVPIRAEVYVRSAEIALLRGMVSEAFGLVSRAIRIDPGHTRARFLHRALGSDL